MLCPMLISEATLSNCRDSINGNIKQYLNYTICTTQILVWKELDYGKMSEKEKQLVVTEASDTRSLSLPHKFLPQHQLVFDNR